jgi:hypothetical protein
MAPAAKPTRLTGHNPSRPALAASLGEALRAAGLAD